MKTFEEFLNEGMTIPPRPGDAGEDAVRRTVEERGMRKYGDCVVRWYRGERAAGRADRPRIWALNACLTLKTYADAVAALKAAGEEIPEAARDLSRIRRYEAFQDIADGLDLKAYAFAGEGAYTLTRDDLPRIRLLGSLDGVALWATRGYRTTNKFVHHLWKNGRTLGRGGAWGDPDVQSPYCTHSKARWDEYAKGRDWYEQYWFLRYGRGDFPEGARGGMDDPDVVEAYRSAEGRGAELLICMDDTDGDLLDRCDNPMRGGFDDLDDWNEANACEVLSREYRGDGGEEETAEAGKEEDA